MAFYSAVSCAAVRGWLGRHRGQCPNCVAMMPPNLPGTPERKLAMIATMTRPPLVLLYKESRRHARNT